MSNNQQGGEHQFSILSPKILNNVSINKSQNYITSTRDKKQPDLFSDERSPESQMKLQHVLEYIKKVRDQNRAHSLVMNLPSRMLKSFDNNKFNLLNDKSFHYDEQTYLELINQSKKNSQLNNNSMTYDTKFQDKIRQTQTLNNQNSRHINYFTQDQVLTNSKTDKLPKLIEFKNYYRNFIILKLFFVKVFEYVPVILPSSPLNFIMDLIFMVLVIVCLFFLPVTISFGFTFQDMLSYWSLITIPTLILLNTFFKINTGYYKKGQVIVNRFQIMKKYIKKTFIKDIICVFPLVFTLYHQAKKSSQEKVQDDDQTNFSFQLLLLPFIFKAFSINSTLKKFEERFNLSRHLLNTIQLVKLLFTIVFINHLNACIWLYAARIQRQSGADKIWLNYNNLMNANWQTQYTAGFYFMTVTMVTVGYGDILPQNQLEYFLSVITMMLACGVFGYSLNEVGSIFNNFFQVDREIKRKQILIQRFMSTKNINTKLQYQIREYLEYYWREQAETDYEEKQQIIDQLSDSLRQKLLFEANKIVLRDNPIFKQNFSKTVIEQTVPLILEMKYSPESIICQKGVQDDCSIYFIEKGSVEIVINPKGIKKGELLKLNKGESFGSHSFFTGLPRINNIRSSEFTTILKIRRQDFLQLLSIYPEDYETFCFIRDQISFLNDYSKIGQVCKSCKSSYHMVNDCQYLHYISNKARIIKMYNDENNIQQIERVPYGRRNPNINYHYKNSLVVYNDVVKQNLIFLEQNESLLNLSDDEAEFSEGYFNQESFKEQQNQSRNIQNDGTNSKKEICQITELSSNKEQENESNFKRTLMKKNTLSKFGQDYSHTLSRSLNTIEKNLDSALENAVLQNDIQSLNIPDISYQQHQAQFNSPSLDYDTLSKKNVITPTQRKNYDIQFNTLNRMRTNTADKSEINISFNQANQTFTSEINSRMASQQVKLINGFLNEDGLEKQKKNKNIQQKIQKNRSYISQISQDELEKTLSLDNKNMQGSNNNQNDKKSKRIQNKQPMTVGDQIGLILKQVQFLVNQNKQNQIDEKKKQLQKESDSGEFFISQNFDKMRQFTKYNPRYNFSSVISRFNQIQDQIKRNFRSKKSQRIKKLTNHMTKTQLNTFLESKKNHKNMSSNRQNTTNINEYTDSKQDSRKVHVNSALKQDSDLEPSPEEAYSQKFKYSMQLFNQSNDISLQVGNIQHTISQIFEGIHSKQCLNRVNINNHRYENDLDPFNNCEILSDSSQSNKIQYINNFSQQQINAFQCLNKDI